MIKPLNFNWRFVGKRFEEAINQPMEEGLSIDLPHANTTVPLQYVDEQSYQFESTYQKVFHLNHTDQNNHVLIHFEGVAHHAEVYCNGSLVGHHAGGYTAFDMDLTPYVRYDQDNLLTVFVDASESLDIPPFGHVIDYLTFGGIVREVWLDLKHPTHIKDVFVYGTDLLKTPEIIIETTLSQAVNGMIDICLIDGKDAIYQTSVDIEGIHIKHQFAARQLTLWDIDHPYLYTVRIMLHKRGVVFDTTEVVTGFREAVFRHDGFHLNGKRVKLVGLNRHQDYPYVGYAMPKRAQVLDATLLKKQLHTNIVRTSHYPQSRHFIEACDSLGLLVFEEMPGWQHIGGETWKEVAFANVRDMIMRDRNHPSIVLWGVRINESGDDDDFYAKTNQIAHDLDPSRQTGGVRFITNSSVQEDVLALNDFIHDGQTTPLRKRSDVTRLKNMPYLVTEHNGHMFPTKSYDHESKRFEHTKRHLRIMSHAAHDDEICGVIGWCMHDYYTHKDFGSGDRICHHGVLDTFRNTKMAAAAYASQSDNEPYLEISTNFNIGEHAKGFIEDALVFTNCDRVDVYRNDVLIGTLGPDPSYEGLKHPPLVMDWFGGLLVNLEGMTIVQAERIKAIYKPLVIHGKDNLPEDVRQQVSDPNELDLAWRLYGKYVANWGTGSLTYTFKGYRHDKMVIIKHKGNDTQKRLVVYADDKQMVIGDTYDALRITVEAVNEYGDRLIYAHDAFTIMTDDKLDVIGEHTVALIGGIRSFWVKTVADRTGTAVVAIRHHERTEQVALTIIKEEQA